MRAEDILYDLVIERPEDIDLSVIAASLGVKIVYERQNNCAASIVGVGDRAVISVDKYTRKHRQRFSIGHELGHWVHDRGRQIFHCHEEDLLQRWQSQHVEARANRFAADLLMPAKMFVPLAENRPVTLESVRELSEVFCSSLTATAIRFVESSSYPCLACSVDRGTRTWRARSEFFPESLWPRESPGNGTYAVQRKTKSGMVPTASWFDHPDLAGGMIYEDTVWSPPSGCALSLLWWRQNGPILKNDEEEWFGDDDDDY